MDYFEILGKLFGYPSCCVNAFTNDRDELQMESDFIGTGFISCKCCHNTKTTEQILEEINKARVMPIPFSLDINEVENGYYDIGKSIRIQLTEKVENGHNDFEALKAAIVPVDLELKCYKIGRGKRSVYWFVKNLSTEVVVPVLVDGEVVMTCFTKHHLRKGRLVSQAKAEALRAQYPALYNNRDFKFDRSRFTARIGQELFSIKKEDY